MMTGTIKTRFMIISDTHNYDFADKRYGNLPFQHPLPTCDVLLLAGDLTYQGSPKELEGVITMLSSIEAEMKLIIAGNHDLTLHQDYWKEFTRRARGHLPEFDSDYDDPDDHAEAMALIKGSKAKEAGITYLEEGLHTFTLKSGATFSIYASPWQPEFCNMAFNYPRSKDRYNPKEHIAEGIEEMEGVKIPGFPVVDIMMTHGPPRGILDEASGGGWMSAHVGCDALLTAVSRARPKLYCFGHIHEAYGAEQIEWRDDNTITGQNAISGRRQLSNSFPSAMMPVIENGKHTLLVNAALMTIRYRPTNAPWLVDLDLQNKNESA